MSMVAFTLAASLHLFAKDQSLTLFSKASQNDQLKVAFTSTKWKPVEGKSLIVESARNHLPGCDLIFTYAHSMSGTALRARVTPDGIVLPGRVTTSWATYRAVKHVQVGPQYAFSHLGGKLAQISGQCWDATGAAPGKVGQALEAHLTRDDRELFSCHSAIEADKDGGFVVRFTVQNASEKDATFEWGSYKGTVKAGKSQEFVTKSATAPKEADRNCSVSFKEDFEYTFRANAWIAP